MTVGKSLWRKLKMTKTNTWDAFPKLSSSPHCPIACSHFSPVLPKLQILSYCMFYSRLLLSQWGHWDEDNKNKYMLTGLSNFPVSGPPAEVLSGSLLGYLTFPDCRIGFLCKFWILIFTSYICCKYLLICASFFYSLYYHLIKSP